MSRPMKSLDYARRRIREMERTIITLQRIARDFDHDRGLMARLAADGPCFDNPLHIAKAKDRRNEILKRIGLHPDGKPLTTDH